MVIGQMYVRGSRGGKVEGSRVVSSLVCFLATGGGHTGGGAAEAPRGANSCLITAPLPRIGGRTLTGRMFGFSPWTDVSIGASWVKACPSRRVGAFGRSAATLMSAPSGDAATECFNSRIRWTIKSTWLDAGDGVREGEGVGGNGCSLGCNLCEVQGSPSSVASNWPSSPSGPSSSKSRGEKGRGDTDVDRALAERSVCNPTGVPSRDERKSRMGDEVGGISAVEGEHLGDVGIWWGGDDRTSTELATSLVGSAAGAGATWSALGVGNDIGSPRGIVVVKVVPSTEFTTEGATEGEGAREFNCPLAAERGGTEIQASFSLGIMIGKMTRVRMILPVSGSSSSIS